MLFQMLCGEVPFKGSSIPAIMKKHLTLEVPSLSSKGIEGPPQIEAAIRHALEKEPQYRTPSADEFVGELRAAMATASATLKRTGDVSETDASKTLLFPQAEDHSTISVKGSSTAFDPLAGTISAASLLEEEQKSLYAQRELAREAENRRKITDEAEQKRKAEEGGRDAERRHLEELVAKQTKVLEDKLTQLASTMSPKGTAAVDPEATQLQRAGMSTGDTSFQAQSFPRVDVSLVQKKKSSLPLILGMAVVLLIGGGVGGYFIFGSKDGAAAPGKPNNPNVPGIGYQP